MTLWRRLRSTHPIPAIDYVPEENDALVGVLRQAYSSTPVPENLIAGIQEAVRTASIGTQKQQRRVPLLWLRGGFVAVPACAAIAVVLVASGVLNGGGAKPDESTARTLTAGIVWTNAPNVPLTTSASHASPSDLRFRVGPVETGSNSLAPVMGRVHEYGPVGGTYFKEVPVVHCPVSMEREDRASGQICLSSGSVANGGADTSLSAFGTTHEVLLTLPRSAVSGKHTMRKQHRTVVLPMPMDMAHMPVVYGSAKRVCPPADYCWLVRMRPMVTSVTGAAHSGK
jgi:hypothetical protein